MLMKSFLLVADEESSAKTENVLAEVKSAFTITNAKEFANGTFEDEISKFMKDMDESKMVRMDFHCDVSQRNFFIDLYRFYASRQSLLRSRTFSIFVKH